MQGHPQTVSAVFCTFNKASVYRYLQYTTEIKDPSPNCLLVTGACLSKRDQDKIQSSIMFSSLLLPIRLITLGWHIFPSLFHMTLHIATSSFIQFNMTIFSTLSTQTDRNYCPQTHYLSGPLRVLDTKGVPAKAGDLLAVEICNLGPLPGDEWGYTATFDRENGGGFLTDHFPAATKANWYFEGIYASSPHIPGIPH